jgi:uncharacterized membrane protein YeaQ/YmgE (transglycosylase-associated protein family)
MFSVLGEVPLLTISLGNLHLVLYLSQVLYLLVAVVVSLVTELIVGWRSPLSILGAIVAALIGIWIVTSVVTLILPGHLVLFGAPFFKALIGAILFAALWYPHLASPSPIQAASSHSINQSRLFAGGAGESLNLQVCAQGIFGDFRERSLVCVSERIHSPEEGCDDVVNTPGAETVGAL